MISRISAPISAFLVISCIVALLIFFGAWAVSADSKQLGRTLSLGLSGNTEQFAAYDKPSADGNKLVDYRKGSADPFKQAWPGASQEAGSTEDQTWWEKSLLNA
jgi:hypothetical protein